MSAKCLKGQKPKTIKLKAMRLVLHLMVSYTFYKDFFLNWNSPKFSNYKISYEHACNLSKCPRL